MILRARLRQAEHMMMVAELPDVFVKAAGAAARKRLGKRKAAAPASSAEMQQRVPKATKREPARRRGDAAPHEQPAVLPCGVTPVDDPEKERFMLSTQESDPLGWDSEAACLEDSYSASEASQREKESEPRPRRLSFSNAAIARHFPSS